MTAAVEMHSLAPHHLPFFITPPGAADVLYYIVGLMVLTIILLIGSFYFHLHALPEHIAPRGSKVQLQIVSVLALIALFTHNHLYWIAALLLALIPIPDFSTPVREMAAALTRLAESTRPHPRRTAPPPPDSAMPESLDQAIDGKRPVEAAAGTSSHA